MDILIIILDELLLLAVGIYVIRRFFPGFYYFLIGKKPALPEQPVVEIDPPPPAPTIAQSWLAAEPELQALYGNCGDSYELEQRSRELLEELKQAVVVTIPDFDRFQQRMGEVREHLNQAVAAMPTEDPVVEARAGRLGDLVLNRLVEAGEDQAQVLAVLSRNPTGELIPLLEEAPFQRQGKVIWRTPVELDVLHKAPSDPLVFLSLLAELENLVRTSGLTRRQGAKTECLEAMSRLRETVERGSQYMVGPFQVAEKAFASWYLHAKKPSLHDLRRGLDTFLIALAKADGEEAGEGEGGREHLADLARQYQSETWLQTHFLTRRLLNAFLDAELARHPEEERAKDSPAGLLEVVVEEVRSGLYDPEETVRRLRGIEDKGVFVNSLVFGLLRL